VFQGGRGTPMGWECGNVLRGGGMVLRIICVMRKEMALKCCFGMICGVGNYH
jgi:hypothetical protein